MAKHKENRFSPSTSRASPFKPDTPPNDQRQLHDLEQPSTRCTDKESCLSIKSDNEQSVIRDRSASRDSVNLDDPRSSIVDSISATSGRHNWSSIKDIAYDDDPSINSIKGDSVSATIADYNRKHCRTTASSDNQSRTSGGRLGPEPSSSSGAAAKIDDSSVNINYYAASGSSAAGHVGQSSRLSNDIYTNSNLNQNGNNYNNNHHHQHRSRKHSRQRRNNQLQQNQHYRHRRQYSGSSSRLSSALEFDDLPQGTIYQIEPIIIRGNGNLTLFGLSNSFNSEFPQALLGRISREEFGRTISQINSLLKDQQSLSAKLVLIGSLFCCCSLGCSLVWPSIVLKRRSKTNLEKFLANENQRLYSKLGLNWHLGQRCFNRFVEHVLIIELNPKIDPYIPD